jgi:hypothetical protein
MAHAGRHEQPIGFLDPAGAAEPLDDALVVLRAARRRDLRIAPAVILNQLAAAIDEWSEVRIERVDRVGISLFRTYDVGWEIEPADLP